MAFFTHSLAGNKKIQGNYSITGIPKISCSTYLLKLKTNSGAVVSAADGRTPGSTMKKLKITIDGDVYYLLAADTWT